MGCRVDVLDFSSTVTGTHKIIKAQAALERCTHANTSYIAITSGNYGLALKSVAEKLRRKVHIVIGRTREGIKTILEGDFTDVHFIEDLQEYNPSGPYDHPSISPQNTHTTSPNLSVSSTTDHLVESFRAKYGRAANGLTNITTHRDIEHHDKWHSELKNHPIYRVTDVWRGEPYNNVFIPTGSGELLCDLVAQKMGRQPNIYGICPQGHPFIRGMDHTEFDDNVPASRMDKLVTPTAITIEDHFDLDKYWYKNVHFLEASEGDSEIADRVAENADLNSESSGAAACTIAVPSFREKHGLEFKPSDLILVVNTGNGEQYLQTA